MELRQRTRLTPRRCRATALLAALVLTSAALAAHPAASATTPAPAPADASTSANAVCAAPKCKLSNGGSCDRSIAGCPVCLQFIATSNSYACTTISKTTKACPDGFSLCSSAAVTPTATATLTPKAINTPSTASRSSSSSTTSNANGNSNSNSSTPTATPTTPADADKLQTASIETPQPAGEATSKSTTSTTSTSSSSFPTWIIICAGTIVGCILAAVLGTLFVVRQRRRQSQFDKNNESTTNNNNSNNPFGRSPKDFSATTRDIRATTATEFTDSVLDLTTTPSTSKFAYAPATDKRSTTSTSSTSSTATSAVDRSVFLKSDSWRHTNHSHHSFRGSQHINMSYIQDDDPLTASQLTTDDLVGGANTNTNSMSSRRTSPRESTDAFGTSLSSEWAMSGYYSTEVGGGISNGTGSHAFEIDPDGGNNSGNTEFYSSKISAISSVGEDDDDKRQFTHRSSERLTDGATNAKWKQKFYVEL